VRCAGKLTVHCEDAFAAKPADEEGFAGIFVDLFSESQLLPQQELQETWESLLGLLRPQGCAHVYRPCWEFHWGSLCVAPFVCFASRETVRMFSIR